MEELSRRSFVELGLGSLVSLPVLSGGFVLAPRQAHAATGDAATSAAASGESAYTVIDVVYPYQVGFMVVDISKGAKNEAGMMTYPPVEGATVTVTSRFNNKTAAGTTNKNGVANIDVRNLSVIEKGEDVNHLSDYYFNGTVSVVKDGWRKFQTALLAVQGGTGLQVPACPADGSGAPYPLLVSFDEWDALYSKNEFLVTSANSREHTLNVSMLDLPGDGSATVELWVEGEKAARKSVKATLGKRAQIGANKTRAFDPMWGEWRTTETPIYVTPTVATFKARFLKKGDKDAIPAGAKLKLAVTSNGATYSWPLAMKFTGGVIEKPAEKKGQTLSPINTANASTTALDAKWPSGVPMVGGGSLKFWAPELPIDIYVNPFGYVQITLKSPSWGYLDDQGRSDQNGWGMYPRQTVKQQWDKKVKAMKAMTDKTASLVSKPGAIQQIDLFKKFSAQVNFQLVACAQWDSGKGLFQGQVAGQALLGINFTLTENFLAGPIPVLITFALDTSFIVGLSAAAYSAKKKKNEALLDAVFDFSRWKWDYQNTGFTFTLNITPSLSIGVGIRGVASISVKGAITLTLLLGIPLGSQPGHLPSPHFTAGWSASVSLVIEMFFFTKSFALYSKPFANFYDNWEGKDKGVSAQAALAAQAEDRALRAMADLSLEEMLGQLLPITDDMLAMTSEATVAAASLATQSASGGEQDEEPFDWDAAASVVKGQMADGTPIAYTVYDLGAESPEVPDSGGAGGVGALMAASSPALTAQSSKTSAAKVSPAEVRWLSTMADASLPAAGVAALGAQGGIRPSSDTRLFGTDDSHVFGAPRTKVVSIKYSPNPLSNKDETSLWCFRIASVKVSGNMRTRVVANCVEGSLKGRSHVIEFDTGIAGMSHNDLYDYDFDVASNGAYGKWEDCVELVIISGKRAASGTALANASTDLVFTGVRLVGGAFANASGVLNASHPGSIRDPMQSAYSSTKVFAFSRKGNEVINYKTDQHHSILSVQIMPIGKAYNLVTFLDRCAPTPEGVLGDGADVSVGVFFTQISVLNTAETALVVPDQQTLRKTAAAISDKTVYEQDVSLCSHASSHDLMAYTIMLRGSEKAHYVLLGLNTYEHATPEMLTDPYINTPTISSRGDVIKFVLRCQDYDPAIRLVPCPAKSSYLTSYPTDPVQLSLPADQRDFSKWTLHEVSWSGSDKPWEWSNGSEAPKLEVKVAGPAGFNVVNFAVNPKGTFIFWPQSRDADEDRVWAADGTEDVKERPAVYQLMGCRLRNDRFSDPFVVADLAHDTDALAVIDTGRGAAVEALRTEYVDTGERDKQGKPVYHAADIWYTSVPPVRCVTAVACEATDPFVVPGDQIDFRVAVRNDGNVYLAGCTLELCAYNEEKDAYERVPGASAKVTFGKDTVQESNYNPSDGKGGLTGLEGDYALAPGKSAVHAARVTIPKSWKSGERKVLFVASDGVPTADSGVKVQGAGLRTQADDDAPEAVEFHIEPGEYRMVQTRTAPDEDHNPNQRHMDTLHVQSDVYTVDFDPPTLASPGEDGSSAKPESSNGSSGGGTSSRGKLPGTGDAIAPALPLGLLGTALVAAGAATVAYERRRAENEAEG